MTDPHDTESLFAEWLGKREAKEAPTFDVFVQSHPSHEAGLRALHGVWSRIENHLAQRGDERGGTLGDRLRERFGSGVDPEVSLDGDATKTMDRRESESRLYEELHARGPSSGRYRLDGELAQGGMGAILRVYDKDLRRNLAMKVMLEEKQGRLSRFLEEAQVTGQLDHPGIVPVHELGIDARGKVFFTMKLVKGKDLRDVFDMVKAGGDGWNVTRALSVLQRVCEAMAFAHEKKVIHRDLKPGNVMVGRHGEVYVMDWGLARVLGQKETKDVRVAPASQSVVNTERRESSARNLEATTPDAPLLTMDGDAIGTPSYMPLEQAEGNLDAIGPRSDVYAVGAMLYHLLAGHPPYVSPDETVGGRVILKRVLSAPPKPIRTLAKDAPAELIAICEKAMARESGDRYPAMSALGDDLRAYLERRVVKAYRTGVIAETTLWIARNRALAAAIAVAFFALAGFAWQQRIAATSLRAQAAERDRVLQLSDFRELREIQEQGKRLLEDHAAVYRSYRDHASLIEERQTWIARAKKLADQLPKHQASLGALEVRGRYELGNTGSEIVFDSEQDAWWHSAVKDLITGIFDLSIDEDGFESWPKMEKRIAEFETIFARSVGEHRAEWDACIASIGDPVQCPQYKGLEIVPQVGLLPIGRDPQSGLWEFWFVDVTGVKPERGADGQLVLTDDFGLVFVLIPHGTHWIGAQGQDPMGTNYDAGWKGWKSTVTTAAVNPYFLSKYEVTQYQWAKAALMREWDQANQSRRFPADSASWEHNLEWISRLGLNLPTENQWEIACRAGTTTTWSTGNDEASLSGYANISNEPLLGVVVPVGSLAANQYGFHDMHGNLSELCRSASSATDAADAILADDEQGEDEVRVFRGGGYFSNAADASCASRFRNGPSLRLTLYGVRPQRNLSD